MVVGVTQWGITRTTQCDQRPVISSYPRKRLTIAHLLMLRTFLTSTSTIYLRFIRGAISRKSSASALGIVVAQTSCSFLARYL